MHAGLGQQRELLEQGRLLPRHNLCPGLLALGLDQADLVAGILPRPVGISFGHDDRVATPTAVEPVLAMLRQRASEIDHAQVAIWEGDYDHRFPIEVQKKIAVQLAAWLAK